MDIFVLVFKIFGLIFSFWGYYRFARVKLQLKNEFIPTIVLTFIGCVLFVFGCINLLEVAANALLVGGVILFLYSIRYKWSFKQDFSLGIGVWLALIIFIGLRLRGAHLYDCDNYNHWGLIIKNLMYDSAFPDGSDKIIRFTSYPTGSTVVIWYFLRFFNYSDAGALFFQDFLMMSCGISFFAFVDKGSVKRRIPAFVFAILGTLLMFSCDMYLYNGPFDLLVDQLLASLAVAAYLMLEYYKVDYKKALIAILPILSYEISVKNSGILFTYAVGLIFCYRIFKSRKTITSKSKVYVPIALMLCVPLIIRKIWDLHVKFAFDDGGVSIHSVSLANYKSIMADKSPEDLRKITELYLEKAVSFQNYIVSFLVVLVVLYIFFEYKKDKNKYAILNRSLYIIVVYLFYQIGMYCMYIFSMPVYEALCLPCYFRYIMTIDMFDFGIIIMLLIKICMQDNFLDDKGKKSFVKGLAILASLIIIMVYAIDNFLPLFVPRKRTEFLQTTDYLMEVFDKYDFPQDQDVKYLVYISNIEDDEFYSEFTDYKWHWATYYLYSANLNTLRRSQLDDFNQLYEYDCIVVAYEDDEIKEFMAKNGIEYKECVWIARK